MKMLLYIGIAGIVLSAIPFCMCICRLSRGPKSDDSSSPMEMLADGLIMLIVGTVFLLFWLGH